MIVFSLDRFSYLKKNNNNLTICFDFSVLNDKAVDSKYVIWKYLKIEFLKKIHSLSHAVVSSQTSHEKRYILPDEERADYYFMYTMIKVAFADNFFMSDSMAKSDLEFI